MNETVYILRNEHDDYEFVYLIDTGSHSVTIMASRAKIFKTWELANMARKQDGYVWHIHSISTKELFMAKLEAA